MPVHQTMLFPHFMSHERFTTCKLQHSILVLLGKNSKHHCPRIPKPAFSNVGKKDKLNEL